MMSYPPDDRQERDTLPPRITNSNATLDKEKYDKNLIRSPQPADGVNIYDMQNFKKSSQSRPIAPASVTHASLNQPSPFLPHNFGPMYSAQMSSIMMQPGVPYLPVRPDFPFARHIMPLQVSATTGVPPRPPLGQSGRSLAPPTGHHLKSGGLQNQVHAISTMSVPIHPSSNLQQTRSPSPQALQDNTASDGPKGDIKSQATPTEARSVSETRPSVSSEPASRPSLHVNQTTSIMTATKSTTPTSHVKNALSLTTGSVGGTPFGKKIHTATPQMSTSERTIPRTSSIGQPSSASSNFISKVIPHVGQPPTIGTLYSQPPTVSFASRPQQLQDHNRHLKPNTTTSPGSFVGHTGTLTTVVSTSTVPSMTNARVETHRPHPFSFSYFDGHPVPSTLPPAMKPYVPIESVVRKPTTLAQVPQNLAVPSSGHVPTAMNPVQLMTSHSNVPSVAVVNMGVSFPNSDGSGENTTVHNTSQSNSPSIFSVQNMLSTTQSSNSNQPPSSNVTSSSPRPSILRKRQEVTRKPPSQASSADPVVVISANDISASPRSDSTLSASHSRQGSPKSEPGLQNFDQSHKTLENGTSHVSPSKVKRELIPPSSPPASTASNVARSAVAPQDVVASPRKKPRKQNVIATEDKYSSSPIQVDVIDTTHAVNERADQEEDEELKFLMLKRRCVSIFGGYKVNSKAAHNHFQRYSDVKVKDERKPSLQEIANERSITQRATGWKIHHVAAQLDELKSCEEEVLRKMYDFRERLPKHKPEHKRYDDMVMLHELLQGNIQRSQLVIEQLGETKKTTVKILDHKSGIMEILQKNIKRNVKKKG